MSILHQSVVILMTLFFLWFVLRAVPTWGCPSNGEPESLLDDLKWIMINVIVTWITLFLYNHYYGWHRIAEWGSSPRCPRRNSSDPRDGPMTVRAGEFRSLMEYIRRMEERLFELEGRDPRSPSPIYSDEEPEDYGPSKSSRSPDHESEADEGSGSRRVARKRSSSVPPPPPRPPSGDVAPEDEDPPNAQPDPVILSGRRARNRRSRAGGSNSSSSSKSTSSRSVIRYYGVRGGPHQGVYGTWSECSQAIGRGTVHQKFRTFEEALAFSEGDPVRFGRRNHYLDQMRGQRYL